MTDPNIQSIKKSIKPSNPRQSEYLAQANADLVRCLGNLVRAERCDDQ